MITTAKHHVELLAAAGRLHGKTAELVLLKHSESYKDGMAKPCRGYFDSELEEPDEAAEIDAMAQIHVHRKSLAEHLDNDQRLTYDIRGIVNHTMTTYDHWDLHICASRTESIIKTCKAYLKALTELHTWPACD